MFEIIDTTNDEIYFHLAVYADLETAKNELTKRLRKDCAITDSGNDDDYEKIEVRAYKIGWWDEYKTVYTVERNKIYSEDSDEYVWESKITESK